MPRRMKTSFSRSYTTVGADTSATGSPVAAMRAENTVFLAPLARSWTSGSSPRETSARAGGDMYMSIHSHARQVIGSLR